MESNATFLLEKNGRLDKLLAELHPERSRNQWQHLIDEQAVLVNGSCVKANFKVKAPVTITVIEPPVVSLNLIPENIPLDIRFEDDDVIVVNKPQGMVVHPAPGHPQHTLVNALLYHCQLPGINGTLRPGIVHRIDRDTSGLLMVAKTEIAQQSLSAQLKAKTNQRDYLAIVHGILDEDQGTIRAPLGRDPRDRKKQAVVPNGRPAVTHFEVLERFDQFTLIKCHLETGRTHQIRVHFRYIGHPIAGDPVYGPKKTLPGKGQFLHAATLGFEHPTTHQWLSFSVDPPLIFKKTLASLRQPLAKKE